MKINFIEFFFIFSSLTALLFGLTKADCIKCDLPEITPSSPIIIYEENESESYNVYWMPISKGDIVTCTVDLQDTEIPPDCDLSYSLCHYAFIELVLHVDAYPTEQDHVCISGADLNNPTTDCQYGPAIDQDELLYVGLYTVSGKATLLCNKVPVHDLKIDASPKQVSRNVVVQQDKIIKVTVSSDVVDVSQINLDTICMGKTGTEATSTEKNNSVKDIDTNGKNILKLSFNLSDMGFNVDEITTLDSLVLILNAKLVNDGKEVVGEIEVGLVGN